MIECTNWEAWRDQMPGARNDLPRPPTSESHRSFQVGTPSHSRTCQ
jgi:hypothetical protein